MSNISNAISESARSAVVGYNITKGNYAISSPNLPMRIAILSEANTDKITGLSLDPFEAYDASKVAKLLGAGSPAYMAMRVLYPINGGGLSGIPVVIYPVATAEAATASTAVITITGTATSDTTHYPVIAGRTSLDGQSYSVKVVKNDTPTVLAAKYVAAINAIYGCPVTASASEGVITLTSKWKGVSSVFDARVELNGVDAGVSYAIVKISGTGAGDVSTALNKFQNNWNTLVINPYGKDLTVLDLLETFNGVPDPELPTGRYQGITFKPFVSFFSYSTTDPFTDVSVADRAAKCTNVYCPAPNIKHLPVEVAANMAYLVATIGQNLPQLDVVDKAYPDVVVDSNIGIGNYSDWEYRDKCIKAGLSTVDYVGGEVIVKDLVTTYNDINDVTAQFKYVRNLILDWNVRYTYKVAEQIHVVNHVIIPDGTITDAKNTISPSDWKGILKNNVFADLTNRALFADLEFSNNSLIVAISSTNPDRFDTFFRYKRTGIARICSTTAEAGFYYGS